MAGFKNQDKEHAFQQFQRDLKEDKINGLVVLCGIEDYLIKWACNMLLDRYVNPVTKSLDCDMINLEFAELDDIIASCETTPMMSEKKAVVIKGYKNNFLKGLIEYAGDLPDTTLLIICGEEIDNDLKKIGMVYDFEPLQQLQLVSFINKRFKVAGKEVNRSYITTLINESGYYNKDVDYNLYNLESDIKKIIALSDDNITLENIRTGISDNIEHGIFTMLDAISGNRKSDAFALLNQLILSGFKEMYILGQIISQLEIMLQSKELAEDGHSAEDIAKIIKVHQYRVKKALNFVRKYSIKDLKKMLKTAYSTDGKIKMGVLDGHMALELLIAET